MKDKYTSILEIYEKKLRIKNYSNQTISMYSFYVKEFLNKTNKDAYQLNLKGLHEYLFNYSYSSISQQNQIISSLKKFYELFLNKKDIHLSKIERPRKEKRLPQVIDKDFLLDKISKIENLKHKTIISLGYSVGLRVSEVINLKIEDVDSKRMVINIRQAKGKKDRIVPLSQPMLKVLRNYYKEYKPKIYLFNGQFTAKYSAGSCNQIVKKYLGERYHFHLLRHSCFTSLLESGTDIRIIQKIAGHSSSKTTEIYTHISTQLLNKIELPI